MIQGKITSLSAELLRAKLNASLRVGDLLFARSVALQVLATEGDEVLLLPLDQPRELSVGDQVTWSGHLAREGLVNFQWGCITDPLGRTQPYGAVQELSRDKEGGAWGLGRLEQVFDPHQEETFVLAGDESVGPARLLASAVANSKVDWILAVVQGGSRECDRMVGALKAAGIPEKSAILWCPLFSATALSSLIPDALSCILSQKKAGYGLVVFDDLRRWVERARLNDELSGEPLTPEGFSPATRTALSQLLTLPQASENTFGLLAGWSFDRLSPSLATYPYGPLVELLAAHGALLEGHDEGLIPSEQSWGYGQGPLYARDELQKLLTVAPFEAQLGIESLLRAVEDLFLRVYPEHLNERTVVEWKAHHTRRLIIKAHSCVNGEMSVPSELWSSGMTETRQKAMIAWIEEDGV